MYDWRGFRTVVAESPASRPRCVISTARPRFIGHSVENLLKRVPFRKPRRMHISTDSRSEPNKLLAQFLKSWYKNLKDTYWYECHKRPQGGGFFGYWSMEAAGAVKAFGMK